MSGRSARRERPLEFREYHTPTNGIFFIARRRLLKARTPFQKIEVFETDSFGRVLVLDGLVQTTENDEFFYHEMLVHPALIAHPNPRRVLIIGGGDGGTLREVLRYPVEKAQLIEIDAAVVSAARKYFPSLSSSFLDPRAEVFIADGNTFIRQSDERFDVILVDSSDPVGPATVLHQKDFYGHLKDRLEPGGIIAAQSGSVFFQRSQLRKKAAFLGQLFRFARFYFGPVPAYPGGWWCYEFLSDRVDPVRPIRRQPPAGLKYYNLEIHRACFARPGIFDPFSERGRR